MAQDDYYYEIQLTNKQLVFYFMAGATGLILSFLAGVMVGRGVEAGSVEIRPPRLAEERIVAEEPPRPSPQASAEGLTYAQRLESDRAEESLERPRPAAPRPPASPAAAAAAPAPSPAASAAPVRAASAAGGAAAPPRPAPAAAPPARPLPSPVRPRTETPRPPDPLARPAGGALTLQVGAFKDKASAEAVAGRLKAKGFEAYVVSPEGAAGGLFNVRVGSYKTRADADRVKGRLEKEQFKPFVVTQ